MQRPDAVLFEPGLLAVLGKKGGTKRGKACHFNPGFRVSRFEFSLSTLLQLGFRVCLGFRGLGFNRVY